MGRPTFRAGANSATARQKAIAAAAQVISDGIALRNSLPPRQAAEMAWTPTGPSVDQLEARIRTARTGTAELGRAA